MTTTGLRTRRRLGVVLASALAFGGLVALAPTATAAQTGPIAETGVANWGLSDYLNSPNTGRPNPKSDYYVDPADFTPAVVGPPAVPALSSWGEGSGTVNANGSASLSFKGTTVNWALTGNQWLTLSDLQATFDATGTGSVSALVEYGATAAGATEADRWAARTVTRPSQRVTIVDLSPTAEVGDATYPASLAALQYSFAATGTKYSWSGLKGRWSDAFMAHLVGDWTGTLPAPQSCISTSTCWGYSSTVANNVTSGVIRYPSEFKFSIDRQVASTTATPSLVGDSIKIAVAGTGFLKTAPGVYVSLRERTNGDSAYAGGSLNPDLGTAWVSNSAADIGPDPATGAAAAIGDDGSFSVDLTLNAAAVATLDPTKTYTVVTRKGHGQGSIPANASQITETPVNLAALKQTTTVAAPNATIGAGSDAVVNATVTPATGGTPTGTVVLKDGATEKGSAALAGGVAAITVPGLPLGSKSYALEYQGANGYWKSAGTVTISVGKAPSALTGLTGPASVGYRTAATYTVNVSAGTGNVVVTGAGAAVNAPIVSGKATFKLPTTLPAGARTLTFAYAGDASTNAATSVNKKITIAQGATSIAAKVTKKWTAKKAGKLTVTVKSVKSGPVPTGKVTLVLKKGKATKAVAGKVLKNGTVIITLPKAAKGTWSVKATYLGSTQHKTVTKTWKVKVAAK